MKALSDERGVILSWFTRIFVMFAIGGVILFDAGSIVVNYVGLDSTAADIANSLASDVVASNDSVLPTQVTDSAKALTRDAGARLVRAELSSEGVVSVEIRRAADTLVVSHIEALRKYARATATARASTD
jgi:hypothetical protein